jgi:carbamate kinase
MIEAGWDVAIGHGNGPQVGFILRRSEIAHKVEGMHEIPLDVCGADSQGAIGYALQQNLQNEFKKHGVKKSVATVITQVRVDENDKAWKNPSKPIGAFMDGAEAKQREKELGWNVVEDPGGWRRVVASPIPQEVVEFSAVKDLIDCGVVVITVGGGGIPVVRNEQGELVGAAAVIDKDYASSLLARELHVDLLLISTAVEKVALNYGKPDQKWIDKMTLTEAKQYLAAHPLQGLHGLEIQLISVLKWVVSRLDTNPENIGRALRGETGTWIVP